MEDKNKYWIVHGGSDSYFSARDAVDAWERVKEMNGIALEYSMPPTSKVEVVEKVALDLMKHEQSLARRDAEGDSDYFHP